KHYDFKVAILDHAFYKQAPRSKSGLGFRILNNAMVNKISDPTKIHIGDQEIQVHVKIGKKVLRITFMTKWLLNKTTTVFVVWLLLTPILFFLIALLFLRNQISPL